MQPPRPVLVALLSLGILALGAPAAPAAEERFVYLVDISASTGTAGGACGDPNGDTIADTILDCEIVGAEALHDDLVRHSPLLEGLVKYTAGAAVVDAVPDTVVHDDFTDVASNPDGDSLHNMEEALRTVQNAGGTSDFDAGLTALHTLSGSSWDLVAVMFAASDDPTMMTGPGSALQANVDAGTVIYTYGIGAGGDCAPGSSLREISDQTGGTCTEVGDPAQLAAVTGDANYAPTDTDGDGVHDGADTCPTVSGTASNGCTPPPADTGSGDPAATTTTTEQTPAPVPPAPVPPAPCCAPPLVDRLAPATTIATLRVNRRRRTATVTFRSSEANSTFQCKLDARPWRTCRSPARFRRLKRGRHRLRVRAVDPAGNVDATPATKAFRVRR